MLRYGFTMALTGQPSRSWSSRRAPLWDELAGLLKESAGRRGHMNADRLDLLVLRYQQAASDLAYLRTHEPASPLIPRLNDLVARGHAAVYRPRRRLSARAAGRFLSSEYPRLVWEIRRYAYAAAVIQLVLAVAGYAWAQHDPVDAASFLPASMRGVAGFHHHPVPGALMAPSAAGIFTNNIFVSLLDVGGGLTLGVLTLYSLYLNSLLLGVLSGLANRPSASAEYWSLIVPHGVIELTSFTICAGAGLALAAAVVRAGPLPRAVMIRRAGKRAALIAAGTMPLLIVAGTIEGFVTPSGLPVAVKLAVAPATGLVLAAYLRRGRPVTSV
jgi:uncharacterized membrane protein SpoIIM required for sporulation